MITKRIYFQNILELNINNSNDNITTTINNDKIENKDTTLEINENKKKEYT